MLSSQTLGELVNSIPCVSNEMPEEIYEDDELVGYDPNTIHQNSGATLLIEGVLHGDDQSEQDYARYVNFAHPVSSPTHPLSGIAS